MPEITFRAHPNQARFITSEKELVFFGGGLGCGKTSAAGLWVLRRAVESPPGVLGLIAARTYTQLFDSTLRRLYEQWRKFGIVHRPAELPKSHSPFNIHIWTGSGWHEILCRSLERFERLHGAEFGYVLMDEVWLTEKAAFDVAVARCRDPRVSNQIGLVTNLDEPGSWMHKVFVQNYDPDRMDVFYSPTDDNAHNLPDNYIERLRGTYSGKLFDRMVKAKWVSLETGHIYYAFDRSIHASEAAEFEESARVVWSLDFNIGQGKPMSSCLAQIKRQDGTPVLHVWDELILESTDTTDAAQECKERLGGKGIKPADITVYGDATGKARDTRSKKTDYSILMDHGFTKQKVPVKNPPIRDRHNALNSLLRNQAGEVRLLIHPRCKTLLAGLETVKLRSGAAYLEEETREQHVTTALGYLVTQEFPIATRSANAADLW